MSGLVRVSERGGHVGLVMIPSVLCWGMCSQRSRQAGLQEWLSSRGKVPHCSWSLAFLVTFILKDWFNHSHEHSLTLTLTLTISISISISMSMPMPIASTNYIRFGHSNPNSTLGMASAEHDPRNPSFLASPSFVIICACLALEPATNSVLLARAAAADGSTKPTHHIPQGPKNIDEGLISAAVRHTLETTGTAVNPFRVRIPTRAGLWQYDDAGHIPSGNGDGIVENLDNSEPFAVFEATVGEARQIVFYFLANARRVEGQGNGEWASMEDMEAGVVGLSLEETEVVRTGVELARRAGIM